MRPARVLSPVALLASLAAIAGASPAAAAPVATHAQSQSAEALGDYWTPGRMAAAEPASPPPELIPGDPDAPTASAAAQPPDRETNPALDTTFPQRIHGRLFFTIGADDATCSATVVRSRSQDTILTAGHCVVEPGGEGIPPRWATNVVFAPAYRSGVTPYGLWPATRLAAPSRWVREPLIGLDMGAAKLAPSVFGPIASVLGARGVSFNRPPAKYKRGRTSFAIFGYPGQPSSFYDGERLILCSSKFRGFEAFSGSPVAGPCNMKQGSSGGGWVLGGRVNSVVSHGTCPPATIATCTLTSGTYFGDAAFKVWSSIGGGVSKGVKKKLKRCKKKRKGSARAACRGKVQNFKPLVRP